MYTEAPINANQAIQLSFQGNTNSFMNAIKGSARMGRRSVKLDVDHILALDLQKHITDLKALGYKVRHGDKSRTLFVSW